MGVLQARILEWVAMPSSRDGTMDKLKIGKGLHQGYILLPCLFNFYAEYIMWNAGLDESQAGIKTVDGHANGRKWRGTKESFDEGERRKWKSWLKTQHSENEAHGFTSHHFMANRWGKMGTVRDFILGDSKITTDGDWSHEIKGCLLLGRKAMTNLD